MTDIPRGKYIGRRLVCSGVFSHCGRPPLAPELAERIRRAMAVPGRPGIRVIAKQFGVGTGTVQRITHAN